jgi:hypothetical protein
MLANAHRRILTFEPYFQHPKRIHTHDTITITLDKHVNMQRDHFCRLLTKVVFSELYWVPFTLKDSGVP